MSLTFVPASPEVAEPVSTAEQKTHLRIDTTDDDTYIALCVKAARKWIEGQTKRAMMDQTWQYHIDGGWPWNRGGPRIDLPLNPVPAETSPSTVVITYVDTDGVSQTLAQTQYTLVGREHHSYIVPAYNVTWPSVRCVPNAITVQFQAGDSDNVPPELKQAVMILAGHYYEFRETTVDAPQAVESLISPFRKPSI